MVDNCVVPLSSAEAPAGYPNRNGNHATPIALCGGGRGEFVMVCCAWHIYFYLLRTVLRYGCTMGASTHSPGEGGGGYSWEFLLGVCRSVLQILTLFQTKKCHFSHPFSDLASKIHIRFQTCRRSQNATCLFTKTEINYIIIWLLRLERQQNDFLIIHFEFTLYGFISHSFGTNRQICWYTTVARSKTIPDSWPKWLI